MLEQPLTTPPPPRGLARAGIVAGTVAALVVVAGLVVRAQDHAKTRQWSDAQAVPTVHLTTATGAGEAQALVLPGTMQAWNEAKIFARVPGYVHAWYRDIGAKVAAGTPLGSIETPEIDQQIIQARATLARVRAEAALARSTAARWNDLVKSNAVSVQETDEKNAEAKTHAAAVDEAAAALGRLLAMKAYATVRAPFSGEVTMRNADIGDLVGPGASVQTPLFAMADEQRMRVYVNVPQQFGRAMHPGLAASLTIPEAPGTTFPAHVAATSGAVDSKNGAFQVQLVTDNPGGVLKAGGYAQVHFDLPVSSTTVTVPASALVLRGQGTRVATVTPQGRVHLVQVILGRDLGGSVEIASGLARGARVIDNPPDSITEGEAVQIEAGHD